MRIPLATVCLLLAFVLTVSSVFAQASAIPDKPAGQAEQGFVFECGPLHFSAPPLSTGFVVAFLCGSFCALWAQNTGRGPWLWFFLGMLFNVITLVVMLMKNAGDKRSPNPRLFSEGRKIG